MAAVSSRHAFVSPKADGADSTRVRASNWNGDHLYSGGSTGQSLNRNSVEVSGASWDFRRRTLVVNATPVGNVGGGTDDLMVFAIPAGSLATDGQVVRVYVWGTTAANANVKTITLNIGATVITLNPTQTAPNNLKWAADIHMVRTGASAEDVSGVAMIGSTPEAVIGVQPTEALASAVTVRCTGTSGAAATNDIIQRGMIVEQLN